jgi:2'-5' RNA ligase
VTQDPVRAFIALEIPAAVKQALGEGREPLCAELPRARWVRADGQHLTLKFLGEARRDALQRLVADLRPRLLGSGAVAVTLAGGGFFPRPARPRVAWIGGTADGIGPVVEAVERTAVQHGWSAERRPWSLHLTQARLDRPWSAEAVERFLRWAHELRLPEFTCREAVLFSSQLQRGGAVYTPLERLPLE